MAYTPQTWTDNASALTGARMQNIENGLAIAGQYLGSGTIFSGSAAPGDSYYRTDQGTNGSLWQYTGNANIGKVGWICESTIVCTSTTRPSFTYNGLSIYETDTLNSYVYASSAWQFTAGPTTSSVEVTYQTGFAAYNDGLAQWTGLRYSRSAGVVTVSGAWQCTAAVTARQVLATLPVGFRPPFTIQDNAGGLVAWTNGQIVSVNARASGFITSSSMCWSAAS